MDDLEGINKPERINYYDIADWEEDHPSSEIPLEIHSRYENLEKILDQICGYDVKLAEKESFNDRKNLDSNENISPNDFIYGEIVFINLKKIQFLIDFQNIFLYNQSHYI